MIAESTNKVDFINFIQKIVDLNEGKQFILVLDNHKAHHTKDVKAFAESNGIKLLILACTC